MKSKLLYFLLLSFIITSPIYSYSQSTVLEVQDSLYLQSSEDLKSSGESVKQLNCDVGVIDIVSPYSHTILYSVQAVLVKFKNFGTDTVFPNTMTIKFSYATYSSQTIYSDTLLPNCIDSIQFQNVTTSQYNIWAGAMTILACDSDSTNNIFWKRIYAVELKYTPYFNNFDLYDNWGLSFPDWLHGPPAGNLINSPHSGPNVWMMRQGGLYQSNISSYLASPAFDLSSLPSNDTIIVSFWSAMNTPSGDGGLLEYSKDNGINWHILGAVADTNATNWYNTTIGGNPCWSGTWNWQEVIYKLDPQQFSTSDTVIFRFKFFTNSYNSGYDGWAIDDFNITSKSAVSDIGVLKILQPPDTTIAGSPDSVMVVIRNFGNVYQHLFEIQFNISNDLTSYSWHSSLLPGQTDTITFPYYPWFIPLFVSPGNSTLCVWTNRHNDINNLNDTICKSIIVVLPQNDIGVIGNSIFKDPAFPGMNLYKVIVEVKNFGTLPQTSFPINFEIPGHITTSTQTCNKLLMPDSVVIDTFSVNYYKPFMNYYLHTWTSLSIDQFAYNNYKWTYWSFLSQVFNESAIEPSPIGSTSLISSINTESDQNQIMLEQNIPNPASGFTTINFNLAIQGEYIFKVTNILGQQVYSEVKKKAAGNHSIELDLSNLLNGIYYYSIDFERQRITKKMVVSK